ncbi:DUF6434 domain-containing protein [Cellulomonas denverensis]|uniref:DUF6434 domain-containing protein n=1 Tax=Cellulomonas denverensis TaxID=264297 RepID=UPI001A63743E|nr:DUF6434 domain-containing protein [Cellulomonas denverensis]GIG24937.1 hypothetical protein Cde04nite_11810 [Cellulomonas denverensis]
MTPATRPALTPDLSGTELRRWYWLKEELADFARLLGVRATGSKQLLTDRIAARLDGREFAEPVRAPSGAGRQLSGPLTADTVIPPGQRCSQVVRAWLAEQAGPSFHFDAEMRAFFAAADGTRTMGDALDHWHRTRDRGERSIDPQFEYNRFTRAWRREHPEGGRAELLAAWQEYRNLPVDERGRA